jgi:predicted lipoprotein with Yx(FWY)xxD motif
VRQRPPRHIQVRLAAAVVLFPVLLLAAAACGSSSKTASSNPGSSSTGSSQNAGGLYGAPASSSSGTAPSSTGSSALAPAGGAPSVKVATVGGFGQILVDADGNTLYLFEADHGTTTACTGSCVDAWPPVTAASPVAGQGVDASQLSTAQGEAPNQVVYHGHLLYRFAGDHAPGDVNGISVPKWYPVSPSGAPVDKS